MNRFERGFITSGVSLLGAVLIAVPMLAKNMLATPNVNLADAKLNKVLLTPAQLEKQNHALKEEIKSLKTEIVKYKLSAVFTRNNLKQGDKGDDVKGLQLFLSAIPDLYPDATINGIFGANTEKALRVFQDREGLEVTGKLNDETLQKISDIVVSSDIKQEEARVDDLLANLVVEEQKDIEKPNSIGDIFNGLSNIQGFEDGE